MRLAKVSIHGYRKLVGTECRLSGRVLAIVGPNEAGKSTLLDAILCLQDDAPIAPSARPYGLSVEDSAIALDAWFRLSGEDREAIGELDTDDEPLFYIVTKAYDGSRQHRIHPPLSRRTAPRQAAVAAVLRYVATNAAKSLERSGDEGPGDALDHVRELLEHQPLTSALPAADWQVVDALLETLADESTSARGRKAAEALAAWRRQQQEQSPNAMALRVLDGREPLFAKFNDADRSLRSSYVLQEVADDPPAALRNLAALSGLDLAALRDASVANDQGAITTATEKADGRLQSRLNEAWQQSQITVRTTVSDGNVHLLVRTDGARYNQIAEHSDGLRTFLALTAFAHRLHSEARPLVLLIDEAEQHLHYDAQADLVRMLERQGVADQVVYTTHSAGCLPSDLGTGVRAVAPVEGAGRSTVTNSLWTSGPGFTPLLMALGAGAAAFAPSRYAVLGEGPTEMLLLPTMIRQAIGEAERLDYQVAAGLAEVANSNLRALELEAPRVVYIVDGDTGGDAHATRLSRAGVPASRIIQLGGAGSGLDVETLLKEEVHLAALNEVLTRLGATVAMSRTDLTRRESRSVSIKHWCEQARVPVPSKPAVAIEVLQQADDRILSAVGGRTLRTAHAQILHGLGI